MLVVIASKIPESVRGKIKLWFIEPKPYVFVSSVSDAVARKVVEQLIAVCDDDSELLIVESQRKAPGYQLYQKLKSNRILEVCGVQLIKEAASETDMKKVLPKYGIELVEIDRVLQKNGENVISASSVRKYIQKRDLGAIHEIVPGSTYQYIVQNLDSIIQKIEALES